MDVLPAKPTRLALVARQPGPQEQDRRLLVVARDRYDNFCDDYESEIKLLGCESPSAIELTGGRATVRVKPPPQDVIRCTALDTVAELTGTSNPIVSGFADDYTIYFGDLHVMTGEGIIAGALEGTEYAYRWARDVGGLDFCTVTNNLGLFEQDLQMDDEFYNPGEFVTIPGYELGFSIGHKNIYFPHTDVQQPDGSSPETLFASLEAESALVIPHHTSVYSESSHRTFWTEHDFDTHNPAFERLIEITQDRGSMELEQVGGNVYFGGKGSSVWSALQRGMRVGFVGGTDNHRAQPGETRSPLSGLDPEEVTVGGLTAVLASELTREAVWEALYNRCCYATQGQRTLLDFRLAEYRMGSEIDGEAAERFHEIRQFTCRVVGQRPVTSVELVRSDGKVTDVCAVTGQPVPGLEFFQAEIADEEPIDAAGTGSVFYYLRVTEADGRMAWSSPIWTSVA